MGDLSTLRREQALARDEVFETLERLLEEVLNEESPTERLSRARHDVVGKQVAEFVTAVQVAELTRVVAAQQAEIQDLREQLVTKGRATK